jgi:uncharacterized membrane protein YhaH (DUF805 family)
MTELSPIDWAQRPIQRYAEFSGRAPRAEYWWFTLALVVAYIVVSIVESIIGIDKTVGPYGYLSVLLMLGTLVPSIAVGIRRLHDTNRSGWWLLIAIVPYLILAFAAGAAIASGSMMALAGATMLLGLLAFAGGIALLVFMVLPGTKGDNRYGADPYAGSGVTAAA